MEKRLYRKREGKVWAGVFTGLAEYFEIDPVLLRVGWVAFMLGTGIFPGLLFYLIAWAIIPERTEDKADTKKDPE